LRQPHTLQYFFKPDYLTFKLIIKMKKIIFSLFVLFFAVLSNSFAQTATAEKPATPVATTTPAAADFYVGKWEVVFIGTPNGDAKLIATFTRKDGKLEGELKSTTDDQAEVIPITSVEEGTDKLTFGFTAQGYDLTVDLEKVDDDNLKGMMMNMFETKAKRVTDK
jgi:hypothetical protein